jgi:hypothetical protein
MSRQNPEREAMAGEKAMVRTRIGGEEKHFWVDTVINGREMDCPVHVKSIEDGEHFAMEIGILVEQVYRRAYRDGFSSCQSAIKDCLGIQR